MLREVDVILVRELKLDAAPEPKNAFDTVRIQCLSSPYLFKMLDGD